MARKKYILLKDSPELKKGAILEEECDDGDQGFQCITMEEHSVVTDQRGVNYTRQTVMKNPSWFAEVNLYYLTKEQFLKIKKILKI